MIQSAPKARIPWIGAIDFLLIFVDMMKLKFSLSEKHSRNFSAVEIFNLLIIFSSVSSFVGKNVA